MGFVQKLPAIKLKEKKIAQHTLKTNFRSTAEALFPNYLYPSLKSNRMASARVKYKIVKQRNR